MLGRTNATIPLFNISTDLQYSYDGQLWKPFKADGTDMAGCVSTDLTNKILTIKQSGFYQSGSSIHFIRYGSSAASCNNRKGAYQRSPTTYFYLKIKNDVKINLCAIGGGGSASSASGGGTAVYGSGGGAGGTVSYNTSPIQLDKNTILKFQIGDGGFGPGAGQNTSVYIFNPITGETSTLIVSAGGPAASTTAGGAGANASTTNGFYSKRAAGGNSSYNSNGGGGGAGTVWPVNNVTYGGGGGGGGGIEGESNGYSIDYTYYYGGSGGAGGGGSGGRGGQSPGTDGADAYGGGAGGIGGNQNVSSHRYGGNGSCLINFV